MRYKIALAGGTFDHLHKGHGKFLRAAFASSQAVWIGLTSDRFASKKALGFAIEPFPQRKAGLERFLKEHGFYKRSRIIKIDDAAGPNAANGKIDAIFVTKETAAGAKKVNALRKNAGVNPLKIVLVDFALAKDGKRISSTRIRKGEISRDGKIYLAKMAHALRLPKHLVGKLREPIGEFFPTGRKNGIIAAWKKANRIRPSFVAAVGDASYHDLKSIGVEPDLAIIDGKTMRMSVSLPKGYEKSAAKVANHPGTISPSLVSTIKRACAGLLPGKKPQHILVRGEEDLAALPAILALPLGSVVFYGMPKEGVVMVGVNEDTKAIAAKLLGAFRNTRI